jgi:hypothetical protein
LEVRQPRTVKKTPKFSNANIFVAFHFTEKQKKWNSVFVTVDIPAIFSKISRKKWLPALMG